MASTTDTTVGSERNLRERDEFYKETYRFFDALAHHRKLVLAGAVAVVLALVAAGILSNLNDAKAESAKSALFLAEKAYDDELKAMAGYKALPLDDESEAEDAPGSQDPSKAADAKAALADPAKAAAKKAKEELRKAQRAEQAVASKKMEDLGFAKLDVDAKFPQAVKKYNEVITQFDGTRAAAEARMSLGTLYYNHGEPAKAAPIYQAAASAMRGNFEKALAYQSWGYALENDSKFAEAVSAYEKALNYSEGGIKGDMWLGIARCHEALHDTAKARSAYDQILTQIPNSDAAKTAETLKAQLQ